jgi:hypothetical protein
VFPAELEKDLRSIDKDLFDVYGKISDLTGRLARIFDKYKAEPAKTMAAAAAAPVRPKPVSTPITSAPDVGRTFSVPNKNSSSDLSGAQQKVLDALALCEVLGTPQPPRINVAFLAGYTVNGHFNNLVGSLNTAGLLIYPIGGHLALTDAGRTLANANANEVQSLEDFHNLWRSKISGSERKILDVLLQYQKSPIAREFLAEKTGYTINGHFNNMIGHLKTLGAACYPSGGLVAATDVMFPEGLR